MRPVLLSLLALTFSVPAWAGTISLSSADGVALSAELQGGGDRGIVLIHGKGEDRAAVSELTKVFGGSKNLVVAVDLRGHGASKGDADSLASVADVEAAIKYVRGKGVKTVSVVGVGLGANLALVAASKDPEVHDIVMISPALNHDGVKASAGLSGFGERPVLMVIGQGDALATKAANMLDDRMAGSTVEVLPVEGSGSKLVKQSSELPTMILGWWADMSKSEQEAKATAETSPMGEDLKTTGKKLGER